MTEVKTKKKKNHYIDSEKFTRELTKYVELYNQRVKDDKELPIISEYLGKCFWDMAVNMATMNKFAYYPFKDDMISDAVFDATRYCCKFKPDYGSSGFSYFSTIIYYAFLRRIAKEKKALYTKYKVIQNSEIFNTLHVHSNSDENLSVILDDIGYSEGARDNMNEFIKTYEDKINEKREEKEVESPEEETLR